MTMDYADGSEDAKSTVILQIGDLGVHGVSSMFVRSSSLPL